MKYLVFVLLAISFLSCSDKYNLSQDDKVYLNKIIDSMYELDQGHRRYLSKIDSSYNLKISRHKS